VKHRAASSEFQQALDTVCAQALREPVTITKHGRPQVAIMAAEEFERFKRRDRKVGRVEDLPDEWIEAVRQAKVPDEYEYLDGELKKRLRSERSSPLASPTTYSSFNGSPLRLL
jgi:prevent-host-death family protein